MLFVIDVGNTNITCGVYNEDKLICTFRIMSKTPRTSDEFGMTICDLIARNGVEISDIDGVIIASVVPNIMHSLTASIVKYLGIKPLVVGPGIKTGINIDTPNPKEIGPDRIVDAVAALFTGNMMVKTVPTGLLSLTLIVPLCRRT